MPTDYLLSARVFLLKALLQETEYSSQYKKNDLMLNAGQIERTSIYQNYCVFFLLLLKKKILTKQNIASTEIAYLFLAPKVPLLRRNKATISSTSTDPFSATSKNLLFGNLFNLVRFASHLHGQFAIGDNEKNMTIVISFVIFIPRWQTSRANVTASLKSLNKLPNTRAFGAVENWIPATLKTVESFS